MYNALKPLGKYLRLKSVRIYDPIFTLHSKCTIIILLTCTVLLSAKQYFGDPIICLGNEAHAKYLQSFCWTMGTYILPMERDAMYFAQPLDLATKTNLTSLHALVAHNEQYSRAVAIAEGVGPEKRGVTKRQYLRYYQWVFMILLFQSLLFYFPAFLWKIWEGHRMEQLCCCDSILPDERTYNMRLKMLTKYFRCEFRDIHYCYALKYNCCEVLNLIISLFNFWLLDVIFSGFWFKYSFALAAIPIYDWNLWNMMSSRVFPKVAKCEMFMYGPSGSVHILDILCMLPLNVLNEKIFAVLYIWFLFVAMLAALNILYRLLLICCCPLRLQLLRTHLRGMPKSQVRQVLRNLGYGDWFVLMNVAINVNPSLFRELLTKLYEQQDDELSDYFVIGARNSGIKLGSDKQADKSSCLNITLPNNDGGLSTTPAVAMVNLLVSADEDFDRDRFFTESYA